MEYNKSTNYTIEEFKDIKGIIYNSAKKFANNIAFRIKEKIGKDTKYIDITYKKLLEDVNNYGTGLYKKGLKNKKNAPRLDCQPGRLHFILYFFFK